MAAKKAPAKKTPAKTAPTKKAPASAQSPAAFLAALPAARRAEVEAVHALICRAMPDATPSVAGGMIGWGPFRYRYASGREGDAFKVALASRAAGLSVYVNALEGERYLPEIAAPMLGKVDVGRSCIRFQRAADLDERAFSALVRKAAKTKGAGEV
jgi:hypothetical protein